MPKNTATGIYISIFAFLMGFGFVWKMNWLAVLSVIGALVVLIIRMFDEHTEYTIPAEEVKKMEEARMERNKAVESKRLPDEEDMGIIEFVKVAAGWGFGLVRGNKR